MREEFLLDGEKPKDLAPGTARRKALDQALEELDAGLEAPSFEWRQNYSLVLGLERLLSEEPPKLNDGAELNAHQVDALSGTLAALISELEEGAPSNGRTNGRKAAAANGDAAATAEPSPNGEVELDEEEEADELAPDEEPKDWEETEEDEDVVDELPEDPGANRRFWFEHATGAGKTVAAVGFVDASRTGGILILTHRRNLVDQFIGEISDRGYKDRLSPPLLDGDDRPDGPVTVETYQWFVRNSEKVSDAYSIVICDEAHTALGEKTSSCIRNWQGPVFIGMTATGALIARHVADLFPTQTSRFDLAQAARRGVISPLRCIRIPPGPGVRTIAKVPLRKGEVDQDFDQEELAALLDQAPFNVAIADLYKSRFRKVPGVVYTAGVKHANNVAKAFQDAGINARAVSGETPKRELAEILAGFERGEVDVLCNAMLLAEGWNSPRATICMHLAPTASRRVYQQRVGRVTRRNEGKEAGLILDFVHPATTHDETIVTLHSLLNRDVYRGGAIVVGPVRRGRGRKVRVEKRIVPVSDDSDRRMQILERELWRIGVENLDEPEQHVWAALAGARVNQAGWRRAKAMLQHDSTRDLRKRFLLTCLQRNRNQQLRLKALVEVANLKDPDAFDDAIEMVGSWSREDKRAGTKVLLEALAERRIGRRDQAQAWVWRLAEYTRELHEQYAVQRWPETKRLLGLLVNSSGRAHGRNARRHRARRPQQGQAAFDRAARGRGLPYAGGRGGAARRADARGAQALRRRARAAPKLPQGRQAPPPAKEERQEEREQQGREQQRREQQRPEGQGREGFSEATRWTSPAPRATGTAAPVSTRRCPDASTPAATPEPPSQLISRPSSASRSANAARTRSSSASIQSASFSLSAASACSMPVPPPIEVAMSRNSSGNSSIATLSPTPITAQSSLGRPSISTPASFLPSTQTSFGHLTSQRSAGASDSAASVTASGTASGSSGRSPSGRTIAE